MTPLSFDQAQNVLRNLDPKWAVLLRRAAMNRLEDRGVPITGQNVHLEFLDAIRNVDVLLVPEVKVAYARGGVDLSDLYRSYKEAS